MEFKTISGIGQLIFGGIGAIAAVASVIDSIKNGDKRAAITGTYAGKAAVDETAKRYHRTLGGCIIEEPEQN